MAVIVIHGENRHAMAVNAERWAEFWGVDLLLTDGFEARPPFPARRALILSHRPPAAIRRWRRQSLQQARRAPATVEAVVFILAETALRMLATRPERPQP